MKGSWKSLADDKKKRLDATIPSEWRINSKPETLSVMDYPQTSGIMNEAELQITESDATDLVKKLASGQLTSTAVTTAFCKRAALAQQLLNCNLDFFPEMALAQAKALDEYFAEHKKTVGPLHGLPVSLKDQCRIKGLETTMGYVAWIGKYDTEESVLVTLLRNAGAVFYVKTSVPQALMICETVNNIIGRTTNPRNRNWSPGGSSGGEGALIGFRGSVLGVGTDIGGSIRVPAAFNNLFGLRPSHGRLPYAKMTNSLEGQETNHSVCGPMCHTMEDMKLFMTSVLDQSPWEYDSKVVPMPWRQAEEDAINAKMINGGLTLGFYNHDKLVLPHPPVLRAVQLVVDAASTAGHTVVPFEPYDHAKGQDIRSNVFKEDAGADIAGVLKESGEPNIPNLAHMFRPELRKWDINKTWDLNLDKWAYQMEYLEKIRAAEEKLGKTIDAIIAPITATAAVRHDRFKYYGYSGIVNLLDFTSVVVPVTFADKAVDTVNTNFTPISDVDQEVHDEYDPEAYHGAPVAIQVIGRRLTEEKTMAIAKEVARVLKSKQQH